MSSRTPDLLSNIFASGLQPRAATFPRGMIPMKSRGSGEASGEAFVPPTSRRRTAIWDMHHSMHCSIIGTCLSTSEIRRLLVKLGRQCGVLLLKLAQPADIRAVRGADHV